MDVRRHPASPRASGHAHQGRCHTLLAAALVACIAAGPLAAAPVVLDPAFNGGSFAVPVSAFPNNARALAIQHDGKVLAGGWTQVVAGSGATPRKWALVRRNDDGSADTSFGAGTGQVVLKVGTLDPNGKPSGEIVGLAEQADGKILAVGTGYAPYPVVGAYLSRFNADGTLDAGFGNAGIVNTRVAPGGSDVKPAGVAVQGDGRIVVSATQSVPPGDINNQHVVVLRYTPTGSLDRTFGVGGAYVSAPPNTTIKEHQVGPVTIQPDGKIVGGTDFANTSFNFPTFFRLLADGTLDASYSQSDFSAVRIGCCTGVAVAPDGDVYAATSVNNASAIMRVDHNGAIDRTYDGRSWNKIGILARDFVLQPDGKVLVVGTNTLHRDALVLARLTTDGHLDTSFTDTAGETGILNIPEPSGLLEQTNAVKLLADGRIVTTGGDANAFYFARFLADPFRVRPADFAFANAIGVPPSTLQLSNVVRIAGLTPGTQVPINVTGGSYSINGGAYVSTPGYVQNDDRVRVEHRASASALTSTTTTLEAGGVVDAQSPWVSRGSRVVATFTSTTR